MTGAAPVCQSAAGLTLLLAGWAAPRWVAGTRRIGIAALLDIAPVGLAALLLLGATGRPIFAGAAAFALGAGFAFADRVMRETVREPIVFTALSELPQLFTHPHLYLPFAGTGLVLGAAAAAVAAAVALLLIEPAAMQPHPAASLLAIGVAVAVGRSIARKPETAARVLSRLDPSGDPSGDPRGDPLADAARLGPVAMLIAHGIVARAQRPARQGRLASGRLRTSRSGGGPVILVQCESFFDARRALPQLPRGFVAGYDACCGAHGRLEVPAWGANSTRAEFAVLSGVPESALGYDRFNPYHALARTPIASQVWRLRQAGYRTICLHPFDRRFYRRDLALPALGFERFLGSETLGGSQAPPYMSDPELARRVLDVLDAEGPRVFIFAITMGNHGPWRGSWTAKAPPIEPALAELVAPDVPQRGELLRYLTGLRQTDEMLQILADGLQQRGSEGLLACYGDHLPSLPWAFAHLGFADWRSDYAIWSPGGSSCRRDLAAHDLGRIVADTALAPLQPARLDAVVPVARRA